MKTAAAIASSDQLAGLQAELLVQPRVAGEFVSQLFGYDLSQQELEELNARELWGSHVYRAALSIAIESSETEEYDIVERLCNEYEREPEHLASLTSEQRRSVLLAHASATLLLAQQSGNTDTPSLRQYLGFWQIWA